MTTAIKSDFWLGRRIVGAFGKTAVISSINTIDGFVDIHYIEDAQNGSGTTRRYAYEDFRTQKDDGTLLLWAPL